MHGRGVEFLNELWVSICSQTYEDYEVIVSDDSVDNQVRDYCVEHGIDYYRHTTGHGAAMNLNNAISHAKGDIIKPMLEFIGKWNYYERKQPVESWKPSINVITNNKRILNFLIEHDFDKKSYMSADKILSKIPDELKHYFFRGLIDGDGCFYYYKPENGSTLRQFALASSYEQDWSYFEKLCKEKNIKYNIKRTIGKNSSSSVIRITNKDGILKLGEYIYKDLHEDNIGLIRKYEKYKLII